MMLNMTINLKAIKIEYFEEGNIREQKFNVSIGRSSVKRPNTSEIYRFSSGVVSKYDLDEYTHCKLGFNKQFQVITFKFLKLVNPLKIPTGYLKITRDKNVRKVTGVSFARKWKINYDQYAGPYPCRERTVGRAELELAIILSEKITSE